MTPFYSIIVVCLNPGEKLADTVKSIKLQTEQDYEILVKDGMSTDGVVDELAKRQDNQIRIVRKADQGIYDAMNQAIREAKGQYVLFLNCGDRFYDDMVLEKMHQKISSIQQEIPEHKIFYGDIWERLTSQKVASNPKLDDFGCYRNVPCHQACFYAKELLLEHPFLLEYKVRADYEQFLWCYFTGKANPQYVDILIADYEGGGFSETKENRKLSNQEHRRIVEKYMTKGQILKYRLILWLTFAGLRTWIARNEKTAKCYNWCKQLIYRRKTKKE